ncbi:hypothetical protein T265_03255 [Opisthorchis viverrini]|uniref:Uncharacterized protein n=1 Tax=Opisthorchis viverrini TaxID=6198 RepID=A0A075A412_OPIVI|nr:hypothetical protein T265_03255 [Opisthorchis viverrini]KER30310.1 hypothetical protein T265_03255 [Opisthorchis viverrini]
MRLLKILRQPTTGCTFIGVHQVGAVSEFLSTLRSTCTHLQIILVFARDSTESLHTEDFVDPTTTAHTQTIESLWHVYKMRNKRQYGTHRSLVDSYLCEFVWRQRNTLICKSIWFSRVTTESPVYGILQLNVLHTGRLMIQLERYSSHINEVLCASVQNFLTMNVSRRTKIVKLYYSLGESATSALRGYKTKHGLIKDPFTVSTIARLIAEFESIGPVLDFPGKGKKSLSDERAPIVQNAVEQLQSQSTMASSSITQRALYCETPPSSQQDSAPPHYTNQVRTYLREQFSDERVIACRFPNFWPARSSDLAPLNYWFWGMIKARVHQANKPKDSVELRARIEEECARMTPEEVKHTVSHISCRLQLVIEERGALFQYILV